MSLRGAERRSNPAFVCGPGSRRFAREDESPSENHLFDVAQLLLAEEYFVADEEGRRAEGAALDRALRIFDELRLHLGLPCAGEQLGAVESRRIDRGDRDPGIVHLLRLTP